MFFIFFGQNIFTMFAKIKGIKITFAKSVNIAKKYATKVIVVENSNEKRGDEFYKKISNAKWFLFLTASDLITFGLVSEILKITTNSEFDKDIECMKLLDPGTVFKHLEGLIDEEA